MTNEEILARIQQLPKALPSERWAWTLPFRTETCETPEKVLQLGQDAAFDVAYEFVSGLHAKTEEQIRSGNGHDLVNIVAIELSGVSRKNGKDVPNVNSSVLSYEDIARNVLRSNPPILQIMLERRGLSFSLVLGLLGAYTSIQHLVDTHRIPYAIVVQYFGPLTYACTADWGDGDDLMQSGRVGIITIAQWHGGVMGLETPLTNECRLEDSAEEVARATRLGPSRPLAVQHPFLGDYLLEAAQTCGKGSREFLDAVRIVDVRETQRTQEPQYVPISHTHVKPPTDYLPPARAEYSQVVPALDIPGRVNAMGERILAISNGMIARGQMAPQLEGLELDDLVRIGGFPVFAHTYAAPVSISVPIGEEDFAKREKDICESLDRIERAIERSLATARSNAPSNGALN